MTERPLSRRARYRADTRDEAKRIALRQIAEAGLDALSLNGVARQMGMTGPALYRYFAGRDELLAELVADAYGDLADATEAAANAPRTSEAGAGEDGRLAARDRLRAVAAAYRAWALAQPNRYMMLLGTPVGSGALAPERTIPAAHRTMAVLLDALAALDQTPTSDDRRHAELDGQLSTWLRHRDGPVVHGRIARLGVTLWTRLHGVVSLEIAGHFASMGFDPALLYDAEVEAILDEAR